MPWDVPAAGTQGYDPILLYARLKKYYGCFSHAELDGMHYPTFFAYVRATNILVEEEKQQVADAKAEAGGTQPEITDDELQAMFPQVKTWQGKR